MSLDDHLLSTSHIGLGRRIVLRPVVGTHGARVANGDTLPALKLGIIASVHNSLPDEGSAFLSFVLAQASRRFCRETTYRVVLEDPDNGPDHAGKDAAEDDASGRKEDGLSLPLLDAMLGQDQARLINGDGDGLWLSISSVESSNLETIVLDGSTTNNHVRLCCR